MLQRLRHRAQGQEGFTLIELLVVILIIGILAAVAIPTFLSQTGKAKDANMESNINTAQTAEATYQTTNDTFTNAPSATNPTATSNLLIGVEPALTPAFTSGTGKYPIAVTAASTTGYTIAGTSASAITYKLVYNNGVVTRTCTRTASSVNASACVFTTPTATTGTWGGQ